MSLPLFDTEPQPAQPLAEGAVLLRGWAARQDAAWIAAEQQVLAQQPLQAAEGGALQQLRCMGLGRRRAPGLWLHAQ